MAVQMRMRWDGVTPELYDEVRGVVQWDRNPAPGGLVHVAWFVGDQLNVCDVWETPEDFNSFVDNRLMPGVAQVGLPGQPVIEIRTVYNWQLEKPLSAGAVVEEDEIPTDGYKAMEAQVGWRDDPPTGGILHIGSVDGGVMHALSVWESEAHHDKFGSDRIGPVAAALGFPEPPETEFHSVHALFHPEGALTRS